MQQRLRALSPSTELAVVLLVAFGPLLPSSFSYLLRPETIAARTSPPITDAALWSVVAYEVVIMGFLGVFLRLRGWTLARLGITPSVRDTLLGVGVWLVYYLAYVCLISVASEFLPQAVLVAGRTRLVGGSLSGLSITAVSVTNPIFEEVFVCGYLITALRKSCSSTTAINVSAGIRVLYHAYQGAAGVLGVVPMGLIFAYWFSRTGRLWPLIVAHALQDALALFLHR